MSSIWAGLLSETSQSTNLEYVPSICRRPRHQMLVWRRLSFRRSTNCWNDFLWDVTSVFSSSTRNFSRSNNVSTIKMIGFLLNTLKQQINSVVTSLVIIILLLWWFSQKWWLLVFVDRGVKINSQNYLNDILVRKVLSLNQSHSNGCPWTFQQDSSPFQKTKVVQQCSIFLCARSLRERSDPMKIWWTWNAPWRKHGMKVPLFFKQFK